MVRVRRDVPNSFAIPGKRAHEARATPPDHRHLSASRRAAFDLSRDEAGPPHFAGGDMTGVTTMANGTVKWFNSTKGFGFIAPAGGSKDVFVHISAMERAGIRELADGQAVTFDVERGRDGRESAINLALA
jgi:CspA family cold shock protein